MPKVLKDKLNKETEESIWDLLLKEVRKIDSVARLKKFFERFLTRDETILILRRLAIMKLIENKKKYRDIKDILGVSGSTISAVKDIIQGRGYNKKPRKKRNNITAKIRLKNNKSFPKFPTYKGRGRWRFLNNL